MRLVVTGVNGQVTRALQELRTPEIEIIALGRPDLDLADSSTIGPALRAARPDVIVNAAAYTAVDKAEQERAEAFAINADGAGAVAEAASTLGVPIIQLSTDYVFSGELDRAYVESDPTSPCNTYGASKLAGEEAVSTRAADHLILRCAWVHSPYGANFVRTMLRLAESRDEIAVVADQFGGPTSALEIADAAVKIGANLMRARGGDASLRGTFHLAPPNSASWANLAEEIFALSAARGGPTARVRPIPSAEYPTPARRPANSRLDATKLAAAHGVSLPDWRASLALCLDRLVGPQRQDVT